MAIIKIWDKDKEHQINKKLIDNKNISIQINEKNYLISEFKIENNQTKDKNIFIKINNQLYKTKILKHTNETIELYIFNFNKTFYFSLKPPVKIKPANRLSTNDDFHKELTSPIAGRVININVKEGEFVNKNQTLLTIESMKMENEIKASSDCFIKTIQISQSDLVEQNQVLMNFTKKGDICGKSEDEYGAKKV